jgi:type I restriction enzyme, S subunit
MTLPAGWERTSLRELCLPVETTRPDGRPDDQFTYIDISAVDRVSRTIASPQRLVGREAPSRARQLVRAGDVLISTVRPNLRTIARVPEALDGQVASTGFCVLRPAPGVSSDFLFYSALEEGFQRRIQAKARGVSYPAIRDDDILEQQVVVPPSQEQERIVDALANRLTGLEEALRESRDALAAIARLRASVLSAAIRGDLAEVRGEDESGDDLLGRILDERRSRWEARELERLTAGGKVPKNDKWKAKYKEPLEPSEAPVGSLPAGWTWATVDQLAVLVQYGTSAKTRRAPDAVPVLRMGNIIDGQLDLEELKYLPESHSEFPDLFLESGDVLFTRTSGSVGLVGKAAMFRGELEPCSFASYLIRVRFTGDFRPELLVYFLQSPYGRRWARRASSQVGQANINGTKLRALTIPLPPREVQTKICELVESQLAATSRMRKALVAAGLMSSTLRASIISQGLAGALVPQDGSDEPAAALVERLRAAMARREEEVPAKKRRAAAMVS